MKKNLTMDNSVGEVFQTAVGHDILAKLLMQKGLSQTVLTNPIVSHIKLKTVAPLVKNVLDDDFWTAFLHLMNSEKDYPISSSDVITQKWWKEAVFYQIYPRSFYDQNKDGIGDIKGMIEKLDYLQKLGVNALWLSPIYDSPMDDNGYDIRDYQKIHPDFGTMEDFQQLLAQVHQRGMRLIMDLVVNHTSDEHRWFQEAIKSEDNPYRNYYFFSPHSDTAPNNWSSFFAPSAWDQYGPKKDWAMHLFSKKQIDLNWDEPKVRQEIESMVNWWLDLGVDGFRLDVINYISKEKGLPQGDVSVGNLMGYTGIEHYFYGPHLHEYLHELNEKCFAPHKAFSVGETPGLGMKMCQLVTGEDRKELDMVFSFDQLETPGHVRWDNYIYDLNYYRDYIIDWMTNYGNQCWMSLFYNNHDNPRMVSKIDPTGKYTKQIEELLAIMQFTLKGTPFIFQGDEMGLTNLDFHDMSEIQDVESINYRQELLAKGKSEAEAWDSIKSGTRDHVRQLLPWNEMSVPAHLQQKVNPEITALYRALIAFRKENQTLIYGDFEVLDKKKDKFVYRRKLNNTEFVIDCNLSSQQKTPYAMDASYELIYPKRLFGTSLLPYGTRIWKKGK